MRRQDEIVSLFQAADGPFRRLLADLAGDLSPTFDGHAVSGMVRAAMRDAEPGLAALGMSARRSYEPGLAAAGHRIAAPVAGTWSALHLAAGAAAGTPLDAAPDEAEQARQAALHRALLFALEPVRRALTAASADGLDADCSLVLACLSEIPAPESVEALAARLGGAQGASVAVALAIAGSAAGREAVLSALAPAMVAALRYLPEGADGRVGRALHAAAGTSVDAAAACATALAGHPALVAELAPALLARRDPWVTAHLLVALARARVGLPLVLSIARESRVGLVRALAVRAAGAIGTPEARELLVEQASRGAGASQALALELAARDPAALDTSLLVELTKNPHWRVRLNAALALAARDPQAALPALMSLLSSESPVERSSGAFALAYLSGDSAERVLHHLAGDESALVRDAAVASLARHSTPRAHHALLKIALGTDPELGRRALQALAWISGEGAAAVLSRLLEARAQQADPLWRGQLYRTAGALAAGLLLKPAALAAGLESAEPAEVAGSLDGLMLADIGPSDAAAAPAIDHPRVRARAALRGLAGGRLADAETLAQLITGSPPERQFALDATLELLALAPWLGRTPRRDALQKELARALRDPDYIAFAARHLELTQLRAAPAVPAEADVEPPPARLRELPAQAVALVDLPRPISRVSRSTPGYYPPPELRAKTWWRPIAAAAAGLAVILAGGIALRRAAPAPAASRLAPAPATAAPVRLGLTASATATLGEGETVRAESARRVTVTGPYPGPKLQLSGGSLTLTRARSRPDGRLGCDLTFRLPEGTVDVDARPGATRVEIDAAGQPVTAQASRFQLTVTPTGGRVSVKDGAVTLGPPLAKTVPAGQDATWGTPAE